MERSAAYTHKEHGDVWHMYEGTKEELSRLALLLIKKRKRFEYLNTGWHHGVLDCPVAPLALNRMGWKEPIKILERRHGD